MAFFEYNHGRFYYQTVGNGEPIVFLHGFSLDHRMWQPQVERFCRSHQIVVYDMRGFGRSSLPNGSYSHHDDLYALLDHLHIASAHIVGLSLGGEVAIDFALSYPAYVESLCLFDSSMGGFASTVNWNVHAQEVGMEKAKQSWINHEVFMPTRSNTPVISRLQQMVTDYSGWHWLHHDPREKPNPRALDRLEDVSVPTLVAVGELDFPYYQNIADTVTQRIPGAIKHVIPNSGHMTTLENPQVCNALIEATVEKYRLFGVVQY